MNFFTPTRPLVRTASAGTMMLLWAASMIVLWILPSPCAAFGFGGRVSGRPGLLQPADWSPGGAWQDSWTLYEVNLVTCPITIVLTLIVTWWCIERHRSWVGGRPHRISAWFEPQEKRRMRRGLCPLCAYDLRGGFTAGCPECGWNRKDADD